VDAVADVVTSTAEPVAEPVATTVETVASAAEPVVEAAASPADTVAAVADPVTNIVTATAEPLVETAATTVDTAAAGTEAAAPLLAPATKPIDEIAGQTVSSFAAPGTEAAPDITQPLTETVSLATAPVSPALDDLIAQTEPVAGPIGATEPELPAASLPAVDDSIAGALDPATVAGDPIAAAATGPLPDVAAPAAVQFGLEPAVERAIVGTAEDGDPLLEVLTGLAPGSDAGSLIIAAAVTLSGMTIGGAASSNCPSNAQILFTNVRLIPCYWTDNVSRSVAAVGSRAGGRVSAGGVAGRLNFEGLAGEIRDGFMRGAGRLAEDGYDEATDNRLLMQLGIVLGTVYMAFLTIWFWATRIRVPRTQV
jgi:hypothetical protein